MGIDVEANARRPWNRLKAARIGRLTNARILAMTEGLERGNREQAVAFFCECGCREIVPMTPSRYRKTGGAWLPDHKPWP